MSRHDATFLPDPWVPMVPYMEMSINMSGSLATGTLVATNNDAHYVPITFPCDATLYAIRFVASNGTGNYDLGLYDGDLRRLASSGSTAMSAAGVKELALPELRVFGGETYYGALGLSNTGGGTVRLGVSTPAFRATHGWGYEASAVPLPATATPISTTAYAVYPIFAFGVR